MAEKQPALIALEDGSVFRGTAFGALNVTSVGEAVFNTAMTGYQEILTDPSYGGQIVTMTAPMIGNYGVNSTDVEHDKPMAYGFVVRELSPVRSNWRSTMDLSDYLAEHQIPGVEGVDTRSITKRLRTHGAMKACISTDPVLTPEEAVERARAWEGLEGIDYVARVTCREPYQWDPEFEKSKKFTVEGTHLGRTDEPERKPLKLVAFDFGAKYSTLRRLRQRNFEVTVVPADTPAERVRELKPDGIFLSNGPGDPAAVIYAHRTVKSLLGEYPMFGICLGHQIITHALGCKTFKLKFGHRGGNHPIKNLESGRVFITSQNHGYASTPDELEKHGAIVTEINLNDNTVAGLRHKDYPVFCVQYHPEAGPGPNDPEFLFDQFYEAVAKGVN
ncbi:MAG: glutamine-hydrolyzing carbamoyl-phosphate synthase small subunit [Verrucomicrobiota bacterium]